MRCRMIVCLSIWLVLCSVGLGLRADINSDCRVDILDLAILAEEWLMEDEDCMSLGPELVTNGTFTGNANGWTLGDYWEYTSNHLECVPLAVGLHSANPTEDLVIIPGRKYLVSLTGSTIISAPSYFSISLGGATVLNATESVDFGSYVVSATEDSSLVLTASGSSIEVVLDNVSVKEILTTEISTIAQLYNIGESIDTRFGDYVLMNDLDLDYTDGYIGNTNGVVPSDPPNDGHIVPTWDTDESYVVGDIVQAIGVFFYCIQNADDTIDIISSEYWAIIGKVGLGWRGFGYTGAEFTGTFNGNGHTISNLYQANPLGGTDWNAANVRNNGLFGLCKGSRITNLTLSTPVIADTNGASAASSGVGAVCGAVATTAGYFEGVHVAGGTVTGNAAAGYGVGGFIGQMGGSTFFKCSSSANAVCTVANQMAGSFAGGGSAGTFIQCSASGTVTSAIAGGFVGRCNGSNFTDCFYQNATANPAITGATSEGGFGGDTAVAASTFTRCYAAGKLSGTGASKIEFLGKQTQAPTAIGCYYDDTIANGTDDTVATPKTTAEMKTRSTYDGWDFSALWYLGVLNEGYPYFLERADASPVDLNPMLVPDTWGF